MGRLAGTQSPNTREENISTLSTLNTRKGKQSAMTVSLADKQQRTRNRGGRHMNTDTRDTKSMNPNMRNPNMRKRGEDRLSQRQHVRNVLSGHRFNSEYDDDYNELDYDDEFGDMNMDGGMDMEMDMDGCIQSGQEGVGS